MDKDCVLAAAGNNNTDVNPNNIIFTIKDTKLYIPVVTLSASKGFERLYWNDYKAESEN